MGDGGSGQVPLVPVWNMLMLGHKRIIFGIVAMLLHSWSCLTHQTLYNEPTSRIHFRNICLHTRSSLIGAKNIDKSDKTFAFVSLQMNHRPTRKIFVASQEVEIWWHCGCYVRSRCLDWWLTQAPVLAVGTIRSRKEDLSIALLGTARRCCVQAFRKHIIERHWGCNGCVSEVTCEKMRKKKVEWNNSDLHHVWQKLLHLPPCPPSWTLLNTQANGG